MAAAGSTGAEAKAFPSRQNGTEPASDKAAKQHSRCLARLQKSVNKAPYVQFMLIAMKSLGCNVDMERHLVCEPCGGNVLGGYDPKKKQVVLCENTIYSQGCMNDVLTHELVHAYDDCRAHVDWDNLEHLACSEIRAASLSGDCFYWKENFARLNFGWKAHHQKCAKDRATKSILCVRDVTEDVAKEAVDRVFPACFKDTAPFERVPP